jgi:hypothetical protein
VIQPRPVLYVFAGCLAFWLWVCSAVFGATGFHYEIDESFSATEVKLLQRSIVSIENEISPGLLPDGMHPTVRISKSSDPGLAWTKAGLWTWTPEGRIYPLGARIYLSDYYSVLQPDSVDWEADRFVAQFMHEMMGHVLCGNVYWDYDKRGFDFFRTRDEYDRTIYIGPAANVYGSTPLYVDVTGHIGWEWAWIESISAWGHLGDNGLGHLMVDENDLNFMDADYDSGMIIEPFNWAMIADCGWDVNPNARTGRPIDILPRRLRGERLEIITTKKEILAH